MKEQCIACGGDLPHLNPLSQTLPSTEKVTLLKAAQNLGPGRTRIPNPPVCTDLWETEDWVAWVDAHGLWIPEHPTSGDTPEDNPFERDL